MNLGTLSQLPQYCPNAKCDASKQDHELAIEVRKSSFVRNGYYFRRDDSLRVPRFRCKKCNRQFSRATFDEFFQQKARSKFSKVAKLLCSGVSQRRACRILVSSRGSVVHKFRFMAARARLRHEEFLKSLTVSGPLQGIQFDEMESHIHSKLLPVSIPLVVQKGSRKILGLAVCSMPAKGLLAAKSRKKYGIRPDHRKTAVLAVFNELKPFLHKDIDIMTDQKTVYGSWIKSIFPHAVHTATKGRRGCVTGQGELKSGRFDPLFWLNHTAAMLRANVNRLFRRTWNTSKKMSQLEAHLWLYADYHNRVLT